MINQSYPKENKILIIFVSALLLSLVVGWIFYNLFAYPLIRDIYQGKSVGVLNKIIKCKDTLPLEYYFRKTNVLFLIGNLFFIFTSFFSFLFFTRNKKGILGKLNRLFSTRLFSSKDILVLGIGFILAIIFFHITLKYIRISFAQEVTQYWPIGIFFFRLPHFKDVLVTLAVITFFSFALRNLLRIKSKIFYLILICIVLVLGSNLIQGLDNGFTNPISGGGEGGIQYYHDAIKISHARYFLSNFEQLQPNLLPHAQVHPPGAVLTIYALLKMVKQPGFVSVAIAILSVFLSVLFFHKLISTEVNLPTANYVTFLYLLIPALQIYYLATIEALIAGFSLGALYFFMHQRLKISIIGSITFLFLASFLTFAFIFILPVFFGFEMLKRKTIKRSFFIFLGFALIYFVIHILFGFNYFNSFIIASSIEGAAGFRLITSPISYLLTPIEATFEIGLFLGPFLIALFVRGIPIIKRKNLNLYRLTLLSIITLLVVFMSGAYKASETTRICLFIYPYIMFPIVVYLGNVGIESKERYQLAGLLFAQVIFMQLFGNYFW